MRSISTIEVYHCNLSPNQDEYVKKENSNKKTRKNDFRLGFYSLEMKFLKTVVYFHSFVIKMLQAAH